MYKKYKELARFLHAHGCRVKRQGGKHEFWHSPITGKSFPVSRGGVDSKSTYYKMLKQAGIKK